MDISLGKGAQLNKRRGKEGMAIYPVVLLLPLFYLTSLYYSLVTITKRKFSSWFDQDNFIEIIRAMLTSEYGVE